MSKPTRQLVYEGKAIDVSIERWGDRAAEVVEHPGAVAVVAVDTERAITLVRQQRIPAGGPLLELPAGTLEHGEEPLAAARRELAEETGLSGGRWRTGPAVYTTPGFCRELMHLFLAEDLQRGDANPQDDEEFELVRWPVGEIAAHLGEIEDAKTLLGLLLFLGEHDGPAAFR